MQNQKTVVHIVIMFDQYQLLVHISNNYGFIGISVKSLIGTSLLNIQVYIIVLGNNIIENIRKIHCTCTCTCIVSKDTDACFYLQVRSLSY